MRPDQRRARRRDSRPPGAQRQGADRARRGSGSRAPGGAEGIRQRHADARFDASASGAAAGSTRPRRSAATSAFALRSLLRAKGLAATVVVTLALGIGANAAIFSVVRGVLLRPLVNRDEDRLIYIRQSAPGLGAENMTFSVPGDQRPQVARHHDQRLRRLLHRRLHDDRPRRRAARGEGGRRRRLVLRRDGPAPGARPPARTRRTTVPRRRARRC